MGERIDIITFQDIDGYVDGAVSGERRKAVAARIQADDKALRRAVFVLLSNADIRAVRGRVYEDEELAAEVAAALCEAGRKARLAG